MSGGEGRNYTNRFNPPLFSVCVSPWPRYSLTSVVVIFVFKSLSFVLLYCWHLLWIYPYFPPGCIINWNKRITYSIYFRKTLSRCILNGIINSSIKTFRCFLLFYIIFDRFNSFQILCTIWPDDHRIEHGTALQCKTKNSSCHRQSSVRVWSGICAAKSSVFCVVFYRSLFIVLSFLFWSLHCLPFFELWLPITLLASINFSYLLTYTNTIILAQLQIYLTVIYM
jgi:hypothetical protein